MNNLLQIFYIIQIASNKQALTSFVYSSLQNSHVRFIKTTIRMITLTNSAACQGGINEDCQCLQGYILRTVHRNESPHSEVETNMELCLFVKGRMKQVQLLQVHKGHVVALLMIDEYGAFVECIWQGKAIEKPVPMPLCAPHILHGLPKIESGFRW